MANAAVFCGQCINDATLPTLMQERLLFHWQSVHGQQPQWVPMTQIGEPPVPQAQRLDVLTAPQSPTEMLPALPQPRRPLAPCTTSKAMPLSGPMPNRMPQSPARPSGPAPGKQPQQQPVQEGPGQPQVFSHLAWPVATAANCAVAAAEYIAAAGNHIAALGNEGNEGVAARARVQKASCATFHSSRLH